MSAMSKLPATISILVVSVLLLVGCAGDDPDAAPTDGDAATGQENTQPSPTSPDSPTEGATAAADPAGGGFEVVFSELEGLSGEERATRLAEMATEAGEITLYTANSDSSVAAEAFQEAYDVPVQIYRASAGTVLQRITQEAAASGVQGDLAELNALELLALDDQDMLVGYSGPVGQDFPESARYDGWTSHWSAALVPAWNTQAVPSGEAPASYEELAGQEWAGRLIMERDAWEWYMTLHQHFVDQGMSEEEVEELFAGIAANATTADGYLTLNQLLAAREADVAAANYVHLIRRATGEGAPIGWEPPISPGVLIQAGIGLLEGSQNPAGAVLYYEWLLTEGQGVYAELGRSPTSSELAGAGEGGGALSGIELLVPDPDQLLNGGPKWQERYASLFR